MQLSIMFQTFIFFVTTIGNKYQLSSFQPFFFTDEIFLKAYNLLKVHITSI